MVFNVSLGHPGSAFSPPPSSVRRQRHRGPADKEKSRQRAAAREAAGHQETLERAASPPLTDPPQSTSTRSIHPPLFSTATTTAPVMNSTFASVTARPATVATLFKCDRCTAVFKSEGDLKTHMHNHNTPSSMRLYKTMYYHPKDPCPFNAPPPPQCKSCRKTMAWTASRTKANKNWLHEYSCSACTGVHGLSTRTTLTTPPLN